MAINEHDEFLLSQLLDGDLSGEQTAALRARMSREPELGAAYAKLERVHRLLLVQRRSGPEVDYSALRANVMEAVRGRDAVVLRFPRWARAAGLIAAAAAVAIMIVAYRPDGSVAPSGGRALVEHAPAPAVTTPDGPAVPDRGTMLVQFNRPQHRQRSQPAVKVTYARSDERAHAMSARDQERRSRPTWHMYVAQRARPQAATLSPFDMPL